MLRLSVLLAMAVALVTAVPTNRTGSVITHYSEEFGEEPEDTIEYENEFLQNKIEKEMRILEDDIIPNMDLFVPFLDRSETTRGYIMLIDQPTLSCEDDPTVTATEEEGEEDSKGVKMEFSVPYCQVSGTSKIFSFPLNEDDQTVPSSFSVNFVLPLPANETTAHFLFPQEGPKTGPWHLRENDEVDDLRESWQLTEDALLKLEALIDFMEEVGSIEGVDITPTMSRELYEKIEYAFWTEFDQQSGQIEMLSTILRGTREELIGHFVIDDGKDNEGNDDEGKEDEGEVDGENNIDNTDE